MYRCRRCAGLSRLLYETHVVHNLAMSEPIPSRNPRTVLAEWVNTKDEWVRYVVRQVLADGTALGSDELQYAYDLFRQEKLLDTRELPVEELLETAESVEEAAERLKVTKISEVQGVNAIATGAVIEPHDGLTILFGENGTGKTGYARVLKALAGSRTADVILGNIGATEEETQSATVAYELGDQATEILWDGVHGKSPFTRMSVFDSPAVNFHVDEDLEYVYVPAALALFNHVNAGISGVQKLIEDACTALQSPKSALLSRFSRDSAIYAHIETLGAATDLAALKELADTGPKADERVAQQQRSVAALESDSARTQVAVQQRMEVVLTKSSELASVIGDFDRDAFRALVADEVRLAADYKTFRDQLFTAANLPAEPDATWQQFVASGEMYRQHLIDLEVHDDSRCIYCRQPLGDSAVALISKYSQYLEDKIAGDLATTRSAVKKTKGDVERLPVTDLWSYLDEQQEVEEPSEQLLLLRNLQQVVEAFQKAVAESSAIPTDLLSQAKSAKAQLADQLAAVSAGLVTLREQVANRSQALADERKKLVTLTAAVELGKVWAQVASQIADAKEGHKLSTLGKKLSGLKTAVTEMSKVSSDQMVNQSFDALFAEECEALRAPLLKVQYVGRQGKSQRRKIMAGRYKPSKILSEGEQKVLAIADFLAEARLSGITATVVFDDPVSSLDHRRIDEVSVRIAALAESTQVIVFTHDILFATKLLSLFEKSKRCTYYQVTDDGAKGIVTRASGPRWDTIKNLTGRVKTTIQDARAASGETREALVRTGYSWIRSWCEVFVESEVLNEVTMRYQPNVKMGALEKIKVAALPDTIPTVTEVFDRACRYIDGHSQPLPTLYVTPTLTDLEQDWKTLTDCRTVFNKA